jgi:5S rRNA maturation endonuclease (ribonuclease M5)
MVHKSGSRPVEEQFQMVADRLDKKTARIGTNKIVCQCPGHKGKGNTSLKIDIENGKLLFKCFSGCKAIDILKAIGLDWQIFYGVEKRQVEWIPNPFEGSPTPTGTGSVFYYWDETGENQLVKVEKKVRPDGSKDFPTSTKTPGGWVSGTSELKRKVPPYLFHQIGKDKDQPIVWVEGEKDVHTAIEKLGVLATTTIGGSGGISRTDPDLVKEMVRGREIILIPDRDKAGDSYGSKVSDLVSDSCGELVVLELPETVNGKPVKDLTDAVAAGWSFEDLRDAVSDEKLAALTIEAALVNPVRQMESFPLEAFPPEIAEFIQGSAETLMVNPAAVASMVMGVVAGSIGAKRELQVHRGWFHPACLWMVVAMDSGQAKSAVLNLVTRPIREVHKERIREYGRLYAEYQAALEVLEKGEPKPPIPPPLRQLVVGDTTIEAVGMILKNNPDGAILIRDELSSWVLSFDRYSSSSDRSKWLSLNDGTEETINRQKYGVPILLEKPLVSLAGCVQPAVASRLFTSDEWADGFVPRLHICCPPKIRRIIKMPSGPIPHEDTYAAAIRWLIDGIPRTNPFTQLEETTISIGATPEAWRLFKAFGDEAYGKAFEGRSTESSVLSKIVNLQARWSLCHHLLKAAIHQDKNATYNPVEADSMAAGDLVARWFEGEAKRVFGLMVHTAADHRDEEIFRYIESCEHGTTPKELRQKFRKRFPNCKDSTEFLEDYLGSKLEKRWIKLSRKKSERFFLKV